jgi:hypothetical protein
VDFLSLVDNNKSLFWLLFLFPVFLFLQFWLHKEIQLLLFFITRRMNIVIVLFSFVFLPGILVHELSHFISAKLLGVKTGKFSIIPRRLNATQLQLGFVEIEKTDVLRDAIIGAAPLITGCIIVAYIGLAHLDLSPLWFSIWNTDLQESLTLAINSINSADFWIWAYLILVVSSTMFPSKSDRRAWLPLFSFAIFLIGLSWVVGAGPWMKLHLTPMFYRACESISVVILISMVVHLVAVIPLFSIRQLLQRVFVGKSS